MSLTKQLGTGFFLILILVFTGIFWMNLENTRAFVEQQLESHAQDTATSLGLSLTPYVGEDNGMPIVETMIQAIFDRGYYQRITLTDTQNNVLISLENPTHSSEVPDWFVNTFALTAPTAQTEINQGWNIYGQLEVTSNLGIGYQKLYSSALQSVSLMLLAFFVTVLFLLILVRRIIAEPISNVLTQVDAISEQRFETNTLVPSTPEFAKIINALNMMSTKLSTMFAQITKQSEAYRRYAYVDELTNANNRRSFEMTLNKLLADTQNHTQGYVFLIRASSLTALNNKQGIQFADDYLQYLAKLIRDTAALLQPQFTLYRINGADFALIIEDMDEQQAIALAKQLIAESKHLEKDEHLQGVALVGATQFLSGNSFSEIMTKADSALTSASHAPQRWQIMSEKLSSLTNEQWRAKIKALLDEGKAEFAVQPIKSVADNAVVYQEWYARLPDKTKSVNVPMNQLIPASIKLDYVVDIDKLIISNLIDEARSSAHSVGINVTRISLLDRAFCQWLLALLNSNSALCPKLVLEISERTLFHDIKHVSQLTRQLRALGIQITIEHFGAQLASISHLRRVQPSFVKLDGRYVRSIHEHTDNQLFVRSLINIAHGLSINVIAEMIETQEELSWLSDAGVDMVQGYFVETPH